MLIEETIPSEYELFTRLVYDSSDKGYKNTRTKKVSFFKIDTDLFVELINKILEKNKKNKFLIKSEKKFLNFAKKLFKGKKINLKKYSLLVKYSFVAVHNRLRKIKQSLTDKIKKHKFDVSKEDHEYLFSLENILQQIESIDKDLKEKDWYERDDKATIIKKVIIIYKNLNDLALSIAQKDTESLPRISNSILSFDNIQFNVSEKLIS